MRTRILLAVFALLILLGLGGGTWLLVRRMPDPVQHAAMREASGDVRESLLLRRKDVADRPNDSGARLRLAQLLLHAYDPVAAEKGFRAAEAAGADRWAVLQGIGEAAAMQGHWQELLNDVPEAAALQGAPSPAVAASLLLLRGTAQLALSRTAEARAVLATARSVAPDRPEPLVLQGRIAAAGEDQAEAETAVDAALRLDPANGDALMLKLRLLTRQGDRPAAIAMAGRAIAAAPWAIPPRLDRANLLLLANDDAGAQADVDAVLGRAPRVPGARFLQAVLLARAGKDTEAATALERLGPVAELFPRALFIHAVVAARLGQAETAMTLAARYNQRFPADRDGIVLLARNQMVARHPELAVRLLEPALSRPELKGDAALLNLLATAYNATGNTAAALRVGQQAATAAPDDPRVLAGLGLSQLRQGDVSAGLDTLERSAQREPPPAALSDALFNAALDSGDLDRAAAALTRRRAQDGETEAVRSMAAALLLARGDVSGAAEALRTLSAEFPNSVGPKVGLARLMLIQGQPQDAEATLGAVLSREPANLAALTTQLLVWVPQRRFADGLRATEAAEAAAPDDPRLTAMRADLLLLSGDAKGALAVLEARQRARGAEPELLEVLARAQAAGGDAAGALGTYASVLRRTPADVRARMSQVNLLLRDKKVEEARGALTEALAAAPGQPEFMLPLVTLDAHSKGLDAGLATADALRADPANMPAAAPLRGDLLLQAGQPDRAAQAFRAEYQAGPSKALVLRLVSAEAAAGRYEQGATVLRDWMAAHAGDPDAELALARIDLQAGRQDAAQAGLESVLLRRANEAGAMNDLAWIYQTKGDPRAFDLARRSYQLMPAPATADTLGWIMLGQGKVEDAVKALRFASSQAPTDPAIAYHLAVALEKAGKPDESVTLLTAVTARPGAFDGRADAERLLRRLRP